MRRIQRSLSFIIYLLSFCVVPAQAQQYDTAYIARPGNRLTLKVFSRLSGDGIHARGTVNDIYSETDLHTDTKLTFSIGAVYRGIALSLALNPAKMAGKYDDFEVNVNFFTPRISIDASYQNASSLSGDISRNGNFTLEKDYADMRVLNIAAYYCFNHRRFSFPAAFTQSYLQRRSAGSWLAGLSFQGGTITTNPEANPHLPDMRIKARHLGIGGGYGYNLVVASASGAEKGRGWVFHLSAMPTIVVLNYNSLIINGVRKEAEAMRLNMIINERAAVVYNVSPRYFISLTGHMSNSIFNDNVVVINQNKWSAKASFGVRL